MAHQPFSSHQRSPRRARLGSPLYTLGLLLSLLWVGLPDGLPSTLIRASGPVQPPLAALRGGGTQSTGGRALGLAAPSAHIGPRVQTSSAPRDASAAPSSVDLSAYSPPVGDQGEIASCVAWVTAYYMLGWYARHDGYYPAGGPDGAGSFAPMYVYSQLVQGRNVGTTFGDTLNLELQQGVDTRADYTPGDQDYTTQPTAQQRANAAPYKLAGYTTLFVGANQGDPARQMIEAALSSGTPVGIGLTIYDNFWNADSTHYYIDTTDMGANHGNHAVVAFKYDANGLWVENQWGTGWGLNGWVELSWDYVKQYVWQAVTIRPGAPPVAAIATATTPAAAAPSSASSVTPTVPATTTPTATEAVSESTATVTPAATLTPSVSAAVVATATVILPAHHPASQPVRWHRRPNIVRVQPPVRWLHTAENVMTRPRRYSEVPLNDGLSVPHRRRHAPWRYPAPAIWRMLRRVP